MWGVKSERAVREIRTADAAKGQPDLEANTKGRPPGEAHLRSGNEIVSYDVLASDGHIGHVEHFLVDESGWAIRYLVVNTNNWWSGHQVLIAPQWVTGVRWGDRQVSVDLTRDAVRNSRPYSPGDQVGRGEEARILSITTNPDIGHVKCSSKILKCVRSRRQPMRSPWPGKNWPSSSRITVSGRQIGCPCG